MNHTIKSVYGSIKMINKNHHTIGEVHKI